MRVQEFHTVEILQRHVILKSQPISLVVREIINLKFQVRSKKQVLSFPYNQLINIDPNMTIYI